MAEATESRQTGRQGGGETAALTFLIADVRGYTRFTRERGDAAAGMLAKRFADLARDAMEARNGRVIELRGDEALAVFESPVQAVRAAVEFQATCAEESETDPAFPLPVGIGIDVGEAVPVEDGYRGVALNMAARLCSSAGAGQVFVTRAILDLAGSVDGEVRFIERGPATFKGFDEAIEVVEALAVRPGQRPEPSAGNGAAAEALPPELDPLTPLVGREHEMRWFRGTWRRARRGSGRVVFVSGPAQMGKTRLAAATAEHVHAEGAAVLYAGPGGAASALALAGIRTAEAASSPTLLILDDIDVSGPEVAETLRSSIPELSTRPVLVLGLLRDPASSPELAALIEDLDDGGDGERTLGSFDLDGVRGIVRLYAGEDTAEAPIEQMARASGGVPGRVHEVASDWARSEASRRMTAAAEFLAAGRDRHASDLEFANNVIALKLGRLYTVGGRDVLSADVCPYKGLAQFEGTDSAYFFGRERMVGELAARAVHAGLLGVVGASGSGKSSLIAAGLLPSLEAGLLPGSESWTPVAMRPGDRPMEALRGALATDAENPLDSATAAATADRRLVLVVDQFEETFSVCSSEEERALFIHALSKAAGRPDRVAVILAIRGDYYAHCAPYPLLAGALAANHVLVGPLTRDELKRAIELPARRAGLRVESALADALVEEVADEPGGLPLLSTALVELWQAREDGWIRMSAHERTGGVMGAVSRLAESSFAQLSDAEQDAARRVFLRLVASGEGDAVTRRRVPMEEFDLDRDPAAAAVLVRLTQDRLLTTSDTSVEVAHEALLREWPRLRGWLEEDAQGRQLRQHLTQASRQWQSGGREPSELFRGARLSASLDWSADHAGELNEVERDFLAASRQAGELDAERQRRANRRLRGLLVGVALFLVLALIAGALALTQRGSARRSASNAEHSAVVAQAQSLAAQAVAEPRIDLAMLLAREAVALDPSVRTRSDLLATLLRAPTAIRTYHLNANRNGDLAVSPDGRSVAITDNDGNTVVEDTATGRRTGRVRSAVLAYGPDGSLLTGSVTNSETAIGVRDPRTLRITRTIPLPAAFRGKNISTSFVTFGDGGARMAAFITRGHQSQSGPVTTAWRLVQYDYATGRIDGPPIPVPSDIVRAAYAPDGTSMVVVSPQVTQRMDIRTGRRIRSYPVGGGAAALSPDGRTVAIGRGDGSVRFLDLATGKVTLAVGAQGGGVNELDYTPDGRTVVSSGNDGTSLLWDAELHTIRTTLVGHSGIIHTQAISADGSTLYTGGFDSKVLAWDLTGQRGFVPSFVAARTDPSQKAWTLAISPDSRTMAIGSTSGDVELWDLATRRKVGGFHAAPGAVAAVSFSPDGRSLLVASDTLTGGGVWLGIWSLGANPQLVRTMKGIDRLGFISWAAWSPDGRTVAATGTQPNADSSTVGLVGEWSPSTGEPLGSPAVTKGGYPVDVSFAPTGSTVAVSELNGGVEVLDPAHGTVASRFTVSGLYTYGLAFSPDGSKLATTDWGGSVDLWNPMTGKRIGAPILDPDQDVVQSVAWSPDGRSIAATDWDQTLRLFDVATGQEIGPAVQLGKGQRFPYVAFAPDGANVVVADDTGRVWVYPAALKAQEAYACTVANSNFTRAEWKQFVPGLPYRQVCPSSSNHRS
jgi:WD40 repeat protein/class 3 adenylate cyclase